MNQTIEWKKTQPGSTEAVQFTDGMLVTAEDLTAAMRYPLSVVQVLLKAFFGCGIVCGLDLKTGAEALPPQPEQRDAAGNMLSPRPPECDADYMLTIEKGVALGCDGYPIEICGPLKIDLTPDPCRLDRRPKEMFIAIRRVTAAEAAARPCGCGSGGDTSGQQCTRVRDHALIQAFEEDRLPKDICKAAASTSTVGTTQALGTPQPDPGSYTCDCLKQCGECACCGDPWVLLGTVIVGDQGLGAIDRGGRRYVKPIACVCGAPRNGAAAAPSSQAQSVASASLNAAPEAPLAAEAATASTAAAVAQPGTAAQPAAEAQPAVEPPLNPAADPNPATNT